MGCAKAVSVHQLRCFCRELTDRHDPHAAYAGATKPARWSPSELDDVEDAQPLSPRAVSGKISPPRSGNNSGTASPASPSGRPSSPGKIDLGESHSCAGTAKAHVEAHGC